MVTEAEIAAYSATNNYPLAAVRAYVAERGSLPVDDGDFCQFCASNGLLDAATGEWVPLALEGAPATSGLGEWIQANPWLAAGLAVGGLALLSKQNKRRR